MTPRSTGRNVRHTGTAGLGTEVSGSDGASPASAIGSVARQLFQDTVKRRNAWEHDVRPRPELCDLSDGAIRRFLRDAAEYQRMLTEEGAGSASLRMLIHPLLLDAIPRFLRNIGGDTAVEHLPSNAQLDSGDPVDDPDAVMVDGVQPKVKPGELWDRIVVKHMEAAASARTRAVGASADDIEEVLRAQLHWNVRERVGEVALNQFLAEFTVLNVLHAIRERLPDGNESGKRLARMLTSRVEPIEFRKRVSEQCSLRGVNTFDGWFDLVKSQLLLYDGMMIRAAPGHNSTVRVTPGRRHGHSATAQQAQRSTPATEHVPTYARAFAAQGPRKFGDRQRKPPTTPCPVCRQHGHWSRDCPTVVSQRLPQGGAGGPPCPRTAPHAHARQAGDSSDGTVVIGKQVFKFVIDTGATQTFINAEQATQLVKECADVTVVELPAPMVVDIAGESSLSCTFKLVAPVVLCFNSGDMADMPHLELFAVVGLRQNEVLLGRATLHALGVDVVNMTKSALLARSGPAIDAAASSTVSDCEVNLVAAAKRASTADEEPMGNVDERLPDIAAHDAADVARTLEERLQHALEQGLSPAGVTRLREAVTGPLSDVFRNCFSDDPPARVSPIRVEMLPAVYKLKTPPVRRYDKNGKTAMAAIMKRLERYRYVYRNNLATIVSPAYPVRKEKVNPSSPLEEQYRLTVDLRAVNECTVPTRFPLPRLESFMEIVAGQRFFGTLDLFGGYWQLPLHEDSQRFFSILTDCGIWTPTRLIQGSRNAAGPFQAIVSEVLGDCVNTVCVLYIDDIMIFGETEEQFIANWITVLNRLHSVGLKVSAKKTQFYARSVKYCGRVFTINGASFDPGLIDSIIHMSPPSTAKELHSYLATTNWIRSSIPRYAELVQPLQNLLTAALALSKTSGRKPESIRLTAVGWNDSHNIMFSSINAAVAHSVTLAYPHDDKVLCVFTDASDMHWAGVVTQVARDQLSVPVLDQSHEPLSFVSGAFHGSSVKWPVIEKEAFAILETCLRNEHILRRPDGFLLYTDHNNLRFLFSLDPAVFSGRRAAADRVERWSIVLRGFCYDIRHIPGSDNILADLLTRWGASSDPAHASARAARMLTRLRARQEVAAPVAPPAPEHTVSARDVVPDVPVAPTELLTADRDGTVAPVAPAAAPTASTLPHITAPWSAFAHDVLLEFDVDDAPTLEELRRAQRTLSNANITAHNLHLADDESLAGLFVDDAGRVFVPDMFHLRLRLCIVAHQGLGGHRGSETTLHWLTARFTWPGIDKDVKTMCFACLHCLKTKGGKTIPRPWMHIPAANGPNEVIHFDYVYIRAATTATAPEYVLVIVDGFSRFVWLSAHCQANAANTVTSLLQWFGLFGIVRKWVSDQGRHFLNDVVSQLQQRLGADHRFTTAYAPWSNGIAERVGRTLRETLSVLVSEGKHAPDAWPSLLPLVNNVINQCPSSALGGRSPITAFTGRSPTSPLDVVFSPPVDLTTRTLTTAEVSAKVTALEAALSEVTTAVRAITPRDHPTRPGATPVDFDVGDYVLIATRTRGAKDKTAPLWTGPGLVVSAVNARSFTVRDLLSGKSRVIHAEHLKRYADSSLVVTPQLRSFIAASAIITRVEAITAHRKERNIWRLRVQWQGFEDEDSTWEELPKLFQDVPGMVTRYVKTIQDPVVKTELQALLALLRIRSSR